MKTPEIRIFYAHLYRQSISEQLWKQYGWQNEVDSDETLTKYARNYQDAWNVQGARILNALSEALGVDFYTAVIDVACIPGVRQASSPIIMSFHYQPDQFIDALTHELCHVLLTDNTVYSMLSSHEPVDMSERWAKLFGTEHDFKTLVHIPVHALCKHIYLDILQEPGRLERDMEDVANNPPYTAAWNYVNTHDYHAIIEQLRNDYAALRNAL